MVLPDLFARWFESRGWAPRPHQLALVDLARQGRSALLIAPTGGGKTLAGFLPSLIELTERRQTGQDLAYKKGQGELHTLYISPLKALATDILIDELHSFATSKRRHRLALCPSRLAAVSPTAPSPAFTLSP